MRTVVSYRAPGFLVAAGILLSLLAGAAAGRSSPVMILALAPIAALAAIAMIQRPISLLAVAVVLATAAPVGIPVGGVHVIASRDVAFLAIGFVAASVFLQHRRQPRLEAPDLLLVGYLALIAGSGLVWGPGMPLGVTIDAIVPFLIFFAARGLDPEQRRLILWVLLGSCTIGAMSLLYEFFIAGEPVFRNSSSKYWWMEGASFLFRPGGVYSGPPQAATVLGMAMIACSPLLNDPTRRNRLLARLGVSLMALATVVTFARAPIIGIILATALVVTVGRGIRKTARSVAPVLMATLAAILLAAAILPAVESTRIFQQGIARKGTLSNREGYWKAALPVVTSDPGTLLLGHGSELATAVRIGVAESIPVSIAKVPVITTIGVHNQYLLTALELGITGLLALVGWLVAIAISGIRLALRSHGSKRLEATALAASILVALTAFYANELHYAAVLAPLALIAGLSRATAVRPAK